MKLKKVIRWIMFSVIVIPIASVTLLFFSESTRITLVHFFIEKGLAEYNVVIKELKSPSLGEWRIDFFSIQDNTKTLLELESTQIQWQLSSLWNNHIDIKRLSSDKIIIATQWSREQKIIKVADKKSIDKKDNNSSLQNYIDDAQSTLKTLPKITLDKLNIKSLELLDKSLAENKVSLSGKLATDYSKHLIDIDLELKNLSKEEEKFMIKSSMVDETQISLQVHYYESEKGLLNQYLSLPKKKSIEGHVAVLLKILPEELKLEWQKGELACLENNVSIQPTSYLTLKSELKDTFNVVGALNFLVENEQQNIQFQLQDDQILADIDFKNIPISLAQPWIEQTVNGRLNTKGKLSGSIQQPVYLGKLWADVEFEEQEASVDMDGTFGLQDAEIKQLLITYNEVDLKANGKLDYLGEKNHLNIHIKALPLSLFSQFKLDLPENLEGKIDDLQANITGELLHPKYHVKTQAVGVYHQLPWYFNLDAQGEYVQVNIKEAQLKVSEDAFVKAAGQFDFEKESLNIQVNSKEFPLQLLNALDLGIPDDLLAQITFGLDVQGSIQQPQVNSALLVQGHYLDVPFKLTGDASVNDELWIIKDTELHYGDQGIMKTDAKLEKEHIDAHIDLQHIPTELIQFLDLPLSDGQFNAKFKVTGHKDKPHLKGHLHYDTLVHWGDIEGETKHQISTDNKRYRAQMEIHSDDKQLNINSQFFLAQEQLGEIQLLSDITPYWGFDIQNMEQWPLMIRLKGHMEALVLNALIEKELHHVSGRIAFDNTVKGTFMKPSITGSLQVENMEYENRLSGTQLSDIQLSLSLNNQMIDIKKGQATDGNKGILSFAGHMNWYDWTAEDAIDMTLTLNNMRLLGRSDLEGNVDGQLNAKSHHKGLLISGDLSILPLSILINNYMGTDIPTIDVITEKELERKKMLQERSLEKKTPIVLDIQLKAEQQAFLRGKGLDVELKGGVELKGAIEHLSYQGSFQTLRGSLTVLGKKFELNEGSVQFQDSIALLYIPATYTDDELEVNVVLSGTTESLSFAFTSVPALPEDEIISRLLFGKSVTEISPIQALSLANEIQKLNSNSSSFDPIANTRDTLGLDNLSVEMSNSKESTGVSIGAGKYLNEHVYLEIERTPDPATPWLGIIEIELTPRLKLKTTTNSATNATGAELQWVRHY